MNGKQLTIRGMVIGVIGSVVITCSSMYIALKRRRGTFRKFKIE